jgi:mannan endo-1,4-beta-mannosidase
VRGGAWKRFSVALLPIAILLAVLVAPSAGAQTPSGPELLAAIDAGGDLNGFVRSHDGAMTVGGAPWQAVGYNDYRISAVSGGYVCDGDYGEVSDDDLDARLARAQAAGATTIRTWFFQSSWDPDGDGEGDWSAFDRVLAAATRHDLRVVPVLANNWSDCENGAADKDLAFYSGGFRDPQDPDALSYLDYASLVAARYANAPGVAYWQLMNEPEASSNGSCDEAAGADALAGFASEASAAVRAADSNHLISLGTIGGGQCGSDGSDYMRVSDAVDICEIHVYDGEDSGTSPTTPLPGDATNGVGTRISGCQAAGKPIVAGELGFAADLDSAGTPTGDVTDETLANRADFLAARVSAMNDLGLDGFMVWQLDTREPMTDGADTYAVGPCDPTDAVIRAASGVATQQLTTDACGSATDADQS